MRCVAGEKWVWKRVEERAQRVWIAKVGNNAKRGGGEVGRRESEGQKIEKKNNTIISGQPLTTPRKNAPGGRLRITDFPPPASRDGRCSGKEKPGRRQRQVEDGTGPQVS